MDSPSQSGETVYIPYNFRTYHPGASEVHSSRPYPDAASLICEKSAPRCRGNDLLQSDEMVFLLAPTDMSSQLDTISIAPSILPLSLLLFWTPHKKNTPRGRALYSASTPLLQMDGLSQSDEMVFVLAATNLPWELDTAMLRRLEKRILVPLPGGEARLRMLQHLLPPEKYTGLDFEETVEKTAGYSGSDVRLVCKEAAMRPLRRLMSALDEEEGSGSDAPAGDVLFDLRTLFLFVDFSLASEE
jgi:SpoVK/Ycf46/Vps4 family AAA+-type ATPase